MKNLAKFFVPVAVAAIALVSCQKEVNNDVVTPLDGITITVKAGAESVKADAETKTYLGTYNDVANTVLWGTGEYMKLALTAGEETTFANSTADNADAWDGEPEAIFEFSVTPATASSYVYQGIYPASVAVTSSNTNPASYKVILPSAQNATASTYDPAAYIMVAKPETFDAVQTDWTASFRRATALNKVTLKGLNDDITSVKFTLPEGTAFAGRRYIDLTSGESGNIYSGENEIEVLYATAIPANEGGDKVIWFTSWGVELAEGAEITIVAKSATKSYTKTITARSTGIKFKEGYLNTLGISMSGITGEDLADYSGDYLIGAMRNGTWNLMSSTNPGSYFSDTQTSISTAASDVVYTDFSSAVDVNDYIWRVAKNASGYYIQNVSSGVYLAIQKDANEARAATTLDDGTNYAYFTIEVNASGVATIQSTHFTSKVLYGNAGSNRFAFYSSTSNQEVYLIPAVYDTHTKVTLSFTEDTVSKTTDDYAEFTGQTATASPNETAITDNITYTMTGDAIGTIDASTGAVSLDGHVGSATVTATFAGDETYRSATASYSILVTESGSAQWVLVEDAADVEAGDYVITWNNTYYLPNTTSGKKFPVGSGITATAGVLTNEVTEAMIWTFAGDNTNGFTVSAGTYYLQADNSSDGISIVSSPTTPSKWTVIDGSSNGLLLRGNDGGTRNAAVYNNTDWRYYATGSNYTGTLRLYKYTDNTTWNLESIEITNAPDKTEYRVGASFDPSGMEVTAHYVDADDSNNKKDVVLAHSVLTITPVGALSLTDTEVIISYEGKTATQAITVSESSGDPIVISWTRSSSTDTVTSGYELISNSSKYPGANSGGYYQDAGTAATTINYLILQSTSRASAIFTSTPTSVDLTVTLRGSKDKDPLTYNLYACLIDADGNDIAATVATVTTLATNTFADYEVSIPITGVTSAYGVKIYHTKEDGWNLRYSGMTLTIN